MLQKYFQGQGKSKSLICKICLYHGINIPAIGNIKQEQLDFTEHRCCNTVFSLLRQNT